MPDVRHVVLTRFNVPLKSFSKDRFGQATLTAGWLEHRIRLFRDVCVPSMAAQTCCRFRWFLLIDAAGAASLRPRLEAMLGGVDAVILETHDASAWRSGFGEALSPLPDRLLVTRLDNDDALHPDYVRRAQAILTPYADDRPDFLQLPLVLNFSHGMSWNGEQFRRMILPQNAFATWLVGRSERDPAGFAPLPLDVKHIEVSQHFSVIDLRHEEPMWVQLIHDRNISNQARGEPIDVLPGGSEQAFGYLRRIPR
jgi:hypothetical protein